MLWIGDNPSLPNEIYKLARVFHPVSLARQALHSFYQDLTLRSPDLSIRPFPYCTSYFDSDGREVKFKYVKRLAFGDQLSTRMVFLAKIMDTGYSKSIVVKFVEQYNSQAHRLLAEHGLAPQLLFDGTTHPNGRFGSSYAMIVMDYVNGIPFDQFTAWTLLSPRFIESVRNAIRILHNANLVFGDLRRSNVMVLRDTSGTAVKAQLVDFDWCGKHLDARYPPRMNRSLEWAPGMKPGGLMDRVHDEDMMDKLFLV